MKPSIGVAIITHNARTHLPCCLPPLLASPLKPHILVVNSSSSDGTTELATLFGVETLQIPRAPFNHGVVRELARKKLATDIVVMVTPDAYALDRDVLGKLIQPILDGRAACAYARQLPHKGAAVWEAFPRYFNYPQESQLRNIQDVARYGVYTFFFSNSFGAYLNESLEAIGGFSPTLTGEDTLACAQLLLRGHSVAYVAEAQVFHSHNFSLNEEFKRYFDIGLARREQAELFKNTTKRGKEYAYALMLYLIGNKKYHLLPYALLHILAKWAGYSLGKKSSFFPLWLLKRLSSQKNYW